MHRLLLLGLNHATAPLAVREHFAFNGAQRREALESFKTAFPGSEAVLLSTCNRVELYVATPTIGQPTSDEVLAVFARSRGVEPGQFRAHLYEKRERDVVGHVFNVASSLDSMVLGESQILGQVREAYDEARESACT